jgi:hypothetical protein
MFTVWGGEEGYWVVLEAIQNCFTTPRKKLSRVGGLSPFAGYIFKTELPSMSLILLRPTLQDIAWDFLRENVIIPQ